MSLLLPLAGSFRTTRVSHDQLWLVLERIPAYCGVARFWDCSGKQNSFGHKGLVASDSIGTQKVLNLLWKHSQGFCGDVHDSKLEISRRAEGASTCLQSQVTLQHPNIARSSTDKDMCCCQSVGLMADIPALLLDQ